MFKTLTLALVAATALTSTASAFTANALPGDIIAAAEEVVAMKAFRDSSVVGSVEFARDNAAYQLEKGFFKLDYFGLDNTTDKMYDVNGRKWSMLEIATSDVATIAALQN